MAILNMDEEDSIVPSYTGVPETREYRTNAELKTSVLFNKDTELNSIVQHIAGKDWSVDYFLNLTNVNDDLTPPDINKPATIQKYHRINKLVIKLQNSIDQTDLDNINGSAILNVGFTPNLNDAFMATLLGGRIGLFIITAVNIKTYNITEVFEVEFKLFKFLEENSETYNDLVFKTMKEYVYDKDHLLDYSAPIILAADFVKKIDLKNSIPDILDHYLKNFIHSSKNVLALPTDSTIYTDTLLTTFLFKIVNQVDHIDLSKITRLEMDNLDSVYTIWDVIANRDLSLLKRTMSDIGFKYTPYPQSDPTTRQMGYLGINFVVNKLKGSEPVIPNYIDISITPSASYKDPTGPINNYHYVLSESFYKQDETTMGLLEVALTRYLKGEVIDYDIISTLIEQYPMWDTLDQYYLIPILMVLIKDSINNTFTTI